MWQQRPPQAFSSFPFSPLPWLGTARAWRGSTRPQVQGLSTPSLPLPLPPGLGLHRAGMSPGRGRSRGSTGPGSRESQTSGCPEKGLVGTSLWTPRRVRVCVRVCACVCVCVCVGGAAGGRLELQPRPVHCGPGRPGSEAL